MDLDSVVEESRLDASKEKKSSATTKVDVVVEGDPRERTGGEGEDDEMVEGAGSSLHQPREEGRQSKEREREVEEISSDAESVQGGAHRTSPPSEAPHSLPEPASNTGPSSRQPSSSSSPNLNSSPPVFSAPPRSSLPNPFARAPQPELSSPSDILAPAGASSDSVLVDKNRLPTEGISDISQVSMELDVRTGMGFDVEKTRQ